jgi:hypothetical protein
MNNSIPFRMYVGSDGGFFLKILIYNTTYIHYTSHKANPSSELRVIVDSYTTIPWVTWEAVTVVEGTP